VPGSKWATATLVAGHGSSGGEGAPVRRSSPRYFPASGTPTTGVRRMVVQHNGTNGERCPDPHGWRNRASCGASDDHQHQLGRRVRTEVIRRVGARGACRANEWSCPLVAEKRGMRDQRKSTAFTVTKRDGMGRRTGLAPAAVTSPRAASGRNGMVCNQFKGGDRDLLPAASRQLTAR